MLLHTLICLNLDIQVDGVWMSWGSWGECSVTCGGGIQLRNRSCDGPYYNGEECKGSEGKKRCNSHHCPGIQNR